MNFDSTPSMALHGTPSIGPTTEGIGARPTSQIALVATLSAPKAIEWLREQQVRTSMAGGEHHKKMKAYGVPPQSWCLVRLIPQSEMLPDTTIPTGKVLVQPLTPFGAGAAIVVDRYTKLTERLAAKEAQRAQKQQQQQLQQGNPSPRTSLAGRDEDSIGKQLVSPSAVPSGDASQLLSASQLGMGSPNPPPGRRRRGSRIVISGSPSMMSPNNLSPAPSFTGAHNLAAIVSAPVGANPNVSPQPPSPRPRRMSLHGNAQPGAPDQTALFRTGIAQTIEKRIREAVYAAAREKYNERKAAMEATKKGQSTAAQSLAGTMSMAVEIPKAFSFAVDELADDQAKANGEDEKRPSDMAVFVAAEETATGNDPLVAHQSVSSAAWLTGYCTSTQFGNLVEADEFVMVQSGQSTVGGMSILSGGSIQNSPHGSFAGSHRIVGRSSPSVSDAPTIQSPRNAADPDGGSLSLDASARAQSWGASANVSPAFSTSVAPAPPPTPPSLKPVLMLIDEQRIVARGVPAIEELVSLMPALGVGGKPVSMRRGSVGESLSTTPQPPSSSTIPASTRSAVNNRRESLTRAVNRGVEKRRGTARPGEETDAGPLSPIAPPGSAPRRSTLVQLSATAGDGTLMVPPALPQPVSVAPPPAATMTHRLALLLDDRLLSRFLPALLATALRSLASDAPSFGITQHSMGLAPTVSAPFTADPPAAFADFGDDFDFGKTTSHLLSIPRLNHFTHDASFFAAQNPIHFRSAFFTFDVSQATLRGLSDAIATEWERLASVRLARVNGNFFLPEIDETGVGISSTAARTSSAVSSRSSFVSQSRRASIGIRSGSMSGSLTSINMALPQSLSHTVFAPGGMNNPLPPALTTFASADVTPSQRDHVTPIIHHPTSASDGDRPQTSAPLDDPDDPVLHYACIIDAICFRTEPPSLQAPGFKAVSSVTLVNLGLSCADCKPLAEALRRGTIRHLDLRHNNVEDTFCVEVASSIGVPIATAAAQIPSSETTGLQSLLLTGNRVADEGALALIHVLQYKFESRDARDPHHAPAMELLDLSKNRITRDLRDGLLRSVAVPIAPRAWTHRLHRRCTRACRDRIMALWLSIRRMLPMLDSEIRMGVCGHICEFLSVFGRPAPLRINS